MVKTRILWNFHRKWLWFLRFFLNLFKLVSMKIKRHFDCEKTCCKNKKNRGGVIQSIFKVCSTKIIRMTQHYTVRSFRIKWHFVFPISDTETSKKRYLITLFVDYLIIFVKLKVKFEVNKNNKKDNDTLLVLLNYVVGWSSQSQAEADRMSTTNNQSTLVIIYNKSIIINNRLREKYNNL